MARAKRARKAETPKQPSLSLMLRAPYFYPTPSESPLTRPQGALLGTSPDEREMPSGPARHPFPAPPAAEADQAERVWVPLKSRHCVIEGTFDCYVYEREYHVPGATCREDCAVRSKLGNCAIQNRCHWDVVSGCFRKAVCTRVSDLATCRRWEERVICGYGN